MSRQQHSRSTGQRSSKSNRSGANAKPNDEAPVSPFSTGAGGTRFELLVAASYLTDMLLDRVPRGQDRGPVRAVKLQQRNLGSPVDDVILICGGDPEPTLSLQVKHFLRFSQKDEPFVSAIRQCWLQFRSERFDGRRDRIALAFSEEANTGDVRQHIPELLEWAQTSDSAEAFIGKCSPFKKKTHYLGEFRGALRAAGGREIPDTELWQFLRVLVTVVFEFDRPGARDAVALLNTLREIAPGRSTSDAADVAKILFDTASKYAKSAGELTAKTVADVLPKSVAARIPSSAIESARSAKQRLRDQVTRQLTKQQNSRKYIPNLYVESQSPKDIARMFCNPIRFFGQVVEALRRIDLSVANRILRKIGADPISMDIPAGFASPQELVDVAQGCDELRGLCKTWIEQIRKYEGRDSLDRLVPFAAAGKEYRAREMGMLFPAWRIRHMLESVLASLGTLRGGLLLLRSPAGQGKTSFVCDLANLLLTYNVPCMFVTGKDLGQTPSGSLLDGVLAIAAEQGEPARDTVERLRRVCDRSKAPLVLILDAINEHPNIPEFAGRLESLIEALLGLGFVRVVITCRSEYFEHRFANLMSASFADSTRVIKDLHLQMDEGTQGRMLTTYLEFFRISTSFSNAAQRRLESDPFLLRIFCEAYGNPAAGQPIRLPYHPDIYKDRLFSRYLERRFSDLVTRRLDRGESRLGAESLYWTALMSVVSVMLARGAFDGVPVSGFPAEHLALIEDLLHEDVIIRKDLRQRGESSVPEEFIAFPFDELRDYLIAKRLVATFDAANPSLFQQTARELVQAKNTAGEGIGRFLFLEAKRANDADLYELLISEPWLQDILLDCLFGIEESLLTDREVSMLRSKCLSSSDDACTGVQHLMLRLNPKTSPKLNVQFLIELLDALRADGHIEWVYPLFESAGDDRYAPKRSWFPIEDLAERIAESVPKMALGESTVMLLELLLCFLPIRGRDWSYPAKGSVVRLSSGYHETVIAALKRRLQKTSGAEIGCRELWDLVADVFRATGQADRELLQMAISAWRKPLSASLTGVLIDVIRTAANTGSEDLPGGTDEILRNHAKELERWTNQQF